MKRKTQQRAAIRRVLQQARGPLNIQEIHREARKDSPGLGIATVYRTVRSLAENGVVLQVGIPGEKPRYEYADRAHHHFFQCRGCSRVFEVHDCPADLHRLVPQGFVLEDHELFLFGRCNSCTSRNRPSDASCPSSHIPGAV